MFSLSVLPRLFSARHCASTAPQSRGASTADTWHLLLLGLLLDLPKPSPLPRGRAAASASASAAWRGQGTAGSGGRQMSRLKSASMSWRANCFRKNNQKNKKWNKTVVGFRMSFLFCNESSFLLDCPEPVLVRWSSVEERSGQKNLMTNISCACPERVLVRRSFWSENPWRENRFRYLFYPRFI